MLLNSSILVAAANDQEELTDEMDASSDDQIYVGQKCQDTTARTGKELLEETSFTENGLKEKKEGHRNPFSNVPFPSVRNKVALTAMNVYRRIHYHHLILTGYKEKRPLDEVGWIHMAW